MPSRDDVQVAVRRRDRFQCQNCGREGEQYAHIVPESDGGEYLLENMIFLCYRCHNNWLEPAGAKSEMKDRLIELGEALRDQEKTDNVLSNVFTWAAAKTKLTVALGGGVLFTDHARILERTGYEEPPYLSIALDKQRRMHINAYFDNAEGDEFMRIEDNVLRLHTADAWDIVVNRRRIKFEHADRKMMLGIRQTEDLTLHVTGSLYLNGGHFQIADDYILYDEYNIRWSENQSFNREMGMLLSPGRLSF